MNNFWRNLRYGLLFIGFIVIGAYLFASTPWKEWLAGPPTYAAVISDGQPIADAIYRFKYEHDLWPQYMDDLVPKYLPKLPPDDWYYTLTADGPSLAKARSTDKTRTHVGYDFDPKTPTWRVFGEMENRTLKTLSPPTPATTLPVETRQANALAEFDRRMRRERTLIDHWRDKTSYLRRNGRITDARAVVDDALKNFPTHYWPRMALAALNMERTRGMEGTQPDFTHDFTLWVQENPSFTHWYYLSVLQRLANNNPAALVSIEEMAKLPLQVEKDDTGSPGYYLWDATRFALQQERWDLAIAFCDKWEKAYDNRTYKPNTTDELSYLPLRAAARLAKGDAKGALSDLDELADTKLIPWADNIPALRAAAKAGDSKFRYDPGNIPGQYNIFSDPQ